ncbi:hypothetical protein IQ07DRAFT_650894 [Pyrenochaeta sp. DS3sAY3a]|nr:hypothetical protein IQ07DRAFT_650894 [Pyrenochaeta sp. DS3sAY3a]
MSTLNDNSLKSLFAELPEHCIVLLEDADATGLDRAQNRNADAENNGPLSKYTNAKVSLSTLLNVFDGLGSSEGRVLIMTTNHIERLDPALIPSCSFTVYSPHPGDEEEPENNVDRTRKENGTKDCDLPSLAQEFVGKIQKQEFNPAEVMSLLLENKESPRCAIDADTWIKRTREEKGEFTTASLTLDDGESSEH